MRRPLVLALLAFALSGASTSRAEDVGPGRSEEPEPFSPDAFHVELTARGSYATPPVRGGITPFGLGGGLGLDFVFSHVVLGGTVVDYWGGSDDVGSSEAAVLYGLEAGYDVRANATLTLRPMVGVGGATITHTLPPSESGTTTLALGAPARSRVTSPVDVVTQSSSIGGGGGGLGSTGATSVSVTALYVAPGLLSTIALSRSSLLAVGGHLLYLPSVAYSPDSAGKWLSYSLDLDLGVRF